MRTALGASRSHRWTGSHRCVWATSHCYQNSDRSALTGWVIDARHAGTLHARSPMTPRTPATATYVNGSVGVTEYSALAIRRDTASAAMTPRPMPAPTIRVPSRRTSPRTSRGVAPSANRTPNSRVCWVRRSVKPIVEPVQLAHASPLEGPVCGGDRGCGTVVSDILPAAVLRPAHAGAFACICYSDVTGVYL